MYRTIIFVLFLVLGGGARMATLAQTAGGPGKEDNPAGMHGLHEHSDRGYQHRFQNAEDWAKEFDDPARDAWQKPDQIVDTLHLQPTSRVADLGAGTGYFSVRIARRIPQGKLFAVDMEPDMVRYLGERAQREHLPMLVPILATAAGPDLPETVDLVLVVDTYHHIDNRIAYFAALQPSLRPGGAVAVVDFKAKSLRGPPPEHRIAPEKVIAELAAAGYSLQSRHDFLPWQYFLVFRRNGP